MPYKIFVVEDDPVIQAQLLALLTGSGYQTAAVTDFSAVVPQIEAFAPHLLLLDIGLLLAFS